MRLPCLLLAVWACQPPGVDPQNVVIVILDDIGVDKIGLWGLHPDVAPTPTLDRLADDGLRFRRAFALPTCTASRAALLTGRHARRTGMGAVIWPFDTTWELPLDEQTLPELLDHAEPSFTSALAGKWHLSSEVSPVGTELPWRQGFDEFSGSMNNLWVDTVSASGGHGYFEFEKVMPDGQVEIVRRYATSDTTDDAVRLVQDLPEPFLLVVSYNAAHNPWHTPPSSLHSYGADLADPFTQHLAATEALDTELGRLLDEVPLDRMARTWVVAVGDNGSPSEVTTAPSVQRRAKGSVYEGGVRVPMVVVGPGVPAGEVTDAMFHLVDLLPTIAEIGGVDPAMHPGAGPLDGVSQLGVWRGEVHAARDRIYVEDLVPTGPGPWDTDTASLRDGRYELVRRQDGTEELYDLRGGGIDEGPNLLDAARSAEAEAAWESLVAELDAQIAALAR